MPSKQLFLLALLDSGNVKKETKHKSLLIKWKNLDALTSKLNLQHGPWLSGCLLLRNHGNTPKLIVSINNIGAESIIVINLVSKAFAIMLGKRSNSEAGVKRERLWNKYIVMSCCGWERGSAFLWIEWVSFSLKKEKKSWNFKDWGSHLRSGWWTLETLLGYRLIIGNYTFDSGPLGYSLGSCRKQVF